MIIGACELVDINVCFLLSVCYCCHSQGSCGAWVVAENHNEKSVELFLNFFSIWRAISIRPRLDLHKSCMTITSRSWMWLLLICLVALLPSTVSVSGWTYQNSSGTCLGTDENPCGPVRCLFVVLCCLMQCSDLLGQSQWMLCLQWRFPVPNWSVSGINWLKFAWSRICHCWNRLQCKYLFVVWQSLIMYWCFNRLGSSSQTTSPLRSLSLKVPVWCARTYL